MEGAFKQSHCLAQGGNSCTPAQLSRALTHFGMKALMPCRFLWQLGAKGGKGVDREWLEMSVETFVFIFGAWSSVSPKGMDSSEEGWLGWEERPPPNSARVAVEGTLGKTKAYGNQKDANPAWSTVAPFLPLRLGRLTWPQYNEGQKELSWAQ